jgi:hypothetical protein
VWAAGTNTSSTTKSWLPVPRMPTTDQVSSIFARARGIHIVRTRGVPASVSIGLAPSITTHGQ